MYTHVLFAGPRVTRRRAKLAVPVCWTVDSMVTLLPVEARSYMFV